MLVAGPGPTLPALLQACRTVPIVFAQAVDPIGSGSVKSLARPGGNATGFLQFEYELSGKWLELLKEVAPQVKRVGVVRTDTAGGVGQWAVIQAFSRAAGVELSFYQCPRRRRDRTRDGGVRAITKRGADCHSDHVGAHSTGS